ncbi:MAG TPA: helix-turn-helix transcriptional regulator [Chloroflexota bacterium]
MGGYVTVMQPSGVKRVVRADHTVLCTLPPVPTPDQHTEPLAELDVPSIEELKAWRAERGWSQRQVAAELGVPRSAIGNLETGMRANPALRLRVAEALGHPLGAATATEEAQRDGVPAREIE